MLSIKVDYQYICNEILLILLRVVKKEIVYYDENLQILL